MSGDINPTEQNIGSSWIGTGLYAAAGAGTLLVARWAALAPPITAGVLWTLLLVAAIPPLLHLYLRRGWSYTAVLEIAAMCLLALALGAVVAGTRPSVPYGDGRGFTDFLSAGYAFPRWLLGTTAAITLYKLTDLPGLAAHVPGILGLPGTFLATLCAVAMGVGTVAVLRCWPRRLAVTLPILTPVWVLFSTGYVEYYPLIAGAIVAVMVWCFDRRLEQRDARSVGFIAGLLPVLYFGLAGFSLCLVTAYALAQPRKTLVVVGCAALSAAVLIAVCWPQGIVSYLSSLFGEISLGESHTAFPRYQFRSAGDHSFFFSSTYATSASHLRDLVYMFFWGGGWAGPTALVVSVGFALRALARSRTLRPLHDARVLLAVGWLAWQLYYFLYMIPKLGPTHDIDLFFVTYLVVACIAGRMLDSLLLSISPAMKYYVICVALGNVAGASYLLAWIGLTARS